jgi:hypothetical protein
MADPAPIGSDVSAGTYRCTNCGYELGVQSVPVRSGVGVDDNGNRARIDAPNSEFVGQ